jgi:hypothetical protein
LGGLWEDFGRTLGGVWGDFGRTLGRIWEDFGRTLGGLWGDFGRTLGRLWEDPSPLGLCPPSRRYAFGAQALFDKKLSKWRQELKALRIYKKGKSEMIEGKMVRTWIPDRPLTKDEIVERKAAFKTHIGNPSVGCWRRKADMEMLEKVDKLTEKVDGLVEVQERQGEEQRDLRSDLDQDRQEAAKHRADDREEVDVLKKEVQGLKHKIERAESSAPKRPRKAKEPETPEELAKKKQQKELDPANTKVTKAIETMEQDKATEDSLKNALAEGKPVQRGLTAAKKKREKSEFNLAHAKKQAETLEAEFALKFPPAPLALDA